MAVARNPRVGGARPRVLSRLPSDDSTDSRTRG